MKERRQARIKRKLVDYLQILGFLLRHEKQAKEIARLMRDPEGKPRTAAWVRGKIRVIMRA